MNRKLGLIFIFLLSFFIGNAVNVNAETEVLFDHYNPAVSNDENIVYGTEWITQTFTTSKRYVITSIRMKGYVFDTDAQVLTVGLREVNGDGEPVGNDLSVGTVDCNTWDQSYVEIEGNWHSITMSKYALRGGVKYALVFRSPDTAPAYRILARKDIESASFTGGEVGDSSDSGGTWVMWGEGYALMFEIYGEEVVSNQINNSVTVLTGLVPLVAFFFSVSILTGKVGMTVKTENLLAIIILSAVFLVLATVIGGIE